MSMCHFIYSRYRAPNVGDQSTYLNASSTSMAMKTVLTMLSPSRHRHHRVIELAMWKGQRKELELWPL